MKLFRDAAIEGQRRSLHGDVTIHQPVAFKTITIALLLATAIIIFYLANASFSRKEAAPGWIAPQAGMAEVFAPPGSVLQQVSLRVGDRVTKGQIIAHFSNETYGAAGPVGTGLVRETDVQIGELETQIRLSRERRQIAMQKLREQAAALADGIASLRAQRGIQSERLALATRQYADAEPLVQKGYISRFDQVQRKQALLGIEVALKGIDDQIRTQQAQLAQARSDMTDIDAQQSQEEAQLRAARAGLRANAAELGYRSAATLTAPISGVVTAVNLRAGETAKPGIPVISIAPPGPLCAEILLPTRAAGLLRPGQPVHVLVDAFPFQRYGALSGNVESISRAIVVPGEYPSPVKFEQAAYRVRVRLSAQQFRSNGKTYSLEPGMTLTAEIVTERRSILNWLLDPLVAARDGLAR